MVSKRCSYSALFLICIISLFLTCMSTYSKAESIETNKAPSNSNDIKSDPDAGGGRMNVEKKKDPREICSVHRQVCSIHYSLSILGYSLLNYESKPVLPSSGAFPSENNHPREKRDEQEGKVRSENPTLPKLIQSKQALDGKLINEPSSIDEPGFKKKRELSLLTEPDTEEQINVEKDRKRVRKGNRSKEQKTSIPSMNYRQKVLHVGTATLLLEAVTTSMESCLSWSFCSFILILYSVIQLKKELKENTIPSNDHMRSKRRIFRDFKREVVNGEQTSNGESINQILDAILMKVQLMDVKSELIVNSLLRILFIWKNLIKEAVTAHQLNEEKESMLENPDESEVKPMEDYDGVMSGQSILDVSDSYLVPDFSSSDEEDSTQVEDQVSVQSNNS